MRQRNTLKQQYQAVFYYTGLILIMASVLLLTPLLALIFYPREAIYQSGFIFPAAVCLIIGGALSLVFRRKETQPLSIEQAGLIVVFSWIAVCLLSAWPLMAVQGLSFTQALFESVSGWTTTGLSVINVTQSHNIVLLWRSIMQMAGGAGLAVTALAAIIGPPGPALGIAEGRTDQLVPHVRKSAKMVIIIYLGYAVMGILAYHLAGLSSFDAVNHTFAAVSTGGFSTRPESIGYWNSASVEAVTIVLMILGNLNFLTAYLLLNRNFKAVLRNGEVRLMAVVIPISSIAVFFMVCTTLYPTLSKGLRVAVFETVSALTTTGFSTVTYERWPHAAVFVLIILMLIGGGTCSTAGGIKQYRIYILFKSFIWEIRRSFLPRTAVVENYVWQAGRKDFINEVRIRRIGTFFFLYLCTFVLGTLVVCSCGYSLQDSLFEFASAIGTVGLSIGITAPNAPRLLLWTQMAGMFLGRLEFLVIFTSVCKLAADSRSLFKSYSAHTLI